MGTQEIIDMVVQLDPVERCKIVAKVLQSLDKPDPEIDRAWNDEAERRLKAYDEGRIKAIPIEDALGEF
jgi:putative addiction module component (TIGR02574 family)